MPIFKTLYAKEPNKNLFFLSNSFAAALHRLCVSLLDRRVVALSAPAAVQISSFVLFFVHLLSVCSFYFILGEDSLVPNRLGSQIDVGA